MTLASRGGVEIGPLTGCTQGKKGRAMSDRMSVGGLQVSGPLFDFLTQEVLPDTALDPDRFWADFGALVAEFAPRNRALLERRDALQTTIDQWHHDHAGESLDLPGYEAFLREIGYLVPDPGEFVVSTTGVDPEISDIAGPQLVVPVLNARFVLNAANARWGSLYDALYGTDALPHDGHAPSAGYDEKRGAEVVTAARAYLDQFFPLAEGSHAEGQAYRVESGRLAVALPDGRTTGLVRESQFRGYAGDPQAPSSILMSNHGLHVEIQVDHDHPIGARDHAGVKDVILEAAVTTIVDFEDSVAAVDADDKVLAYRNWLLLNQGTLTEEVTKSGRTFVRSLAQDRTFTTGDGGEVTLPGRALLLVRNVGLLMTTDAVLDADGEEIPEGVLDAVVTTLAALPGLSPENQLRNSRAGSVYIVKPKMHGPDEVAFANDLFDAVERLLHLEPNTIKMGIMDEERRTSANLRAAIGRARTRVAFINTGFLDRTGDEIHTSLEAGPMVRKADMRTQAWIKAYEDSNVDAGLSVGMQGRAQIGKGMWAMPDLMADMLQQKVAHPRSGASTAWVPSPTAATLHALHYHQVDVAERQRELAGTERTTLADLLTIPLAADPRWTEKEKQEEVDNNVQSILGYVVRWIDQGIGCSKVPDLHEVALMEDRATLRISSQLLANWLRHAVITPDQVRQSMERMAGVVDQQNSGDPSYRPMTADFESNIAFQTALELVMDGARQPNGYTEPILHRRRREYKAAMSA